MNTIWRHIKPLFFSIDANNKEKMAKDPFGLLVYLIHPLLPLLRISRVIVHASFWRTLGLPLPLPCFILFQLQDKKSRPGTLRGERLEKGANFLTSLVCLTVSWSVGVE